jgi:uncharacterized protein YceK
MKRLVILIGIVIVLAGCATRPKTMQEQAEESRARAMGQQVDSGITSEDVGMFILDVGVGAALDMWLWNNGYPDTAGQRAPDWWTDNR